MKEQWKSIYDDYLISSFGRCYSIKSKKMLTPKKLPNGYFQYSFSKNNKKFNRYIHRLVAEAFIPNPEKLPQVNHKDEDKSNNVLDNLEWCDNSYNVNYGTAKERTAQTLKSYDYGNHIICIETGIEYPSIKQCAKDMGLSASEISRMVFGTRVVNSVKGYHFKLVAKAKGIRR